MPPTAPLVAGDHSHINICHFHINTLIHSSLLAVSLRKTEAPELMSSTLVKGPLLVQSLISHDVAARAEFAKLH